MLQKERQMLTAEERVVLGDAQEGGRGQPCRALQGSNAHPEGTMRPRRHKHTAETLADVCDAKESKMGAQGPIR